MKLLPTPYVVPILCGCGRRRLPEIFCDLIEELAESALQKTHGQKRRNAFRKIYSLIPLVGEASEFFADTPKSILQLLMKKKFILVQGEGRLDLVSPGEVVRFELPEGVDAHLSDEIRKPLESILNRRKRYIAVEELSKSLADNFNIQHLNANIAFECLDHLSREDADARPRTEADLGVLQVLFHVMASHLEKMTKAMFDNLRGLSAIPTETGRLCSAASKVYIVDEAMAKTFMGYAEGLNVRFRRGMHANVQNLFTRLGVRATDGHTFLREVLVPMLTAETASDTERLIKATQSARGILASMSTEQRKITTTVLHEKMWVAVEVAGANELSTKTVRLSQDVVHIYRLPVALAAVWAGPTWLTASRSYYSQVADDPYQNYSWVNFWEDLGCWPALSVDKDAGPAGSNQSRDFNHIVHCLEQMRSTPEYAQNVSLDLVQWLAPHGSFYAKYLGSPVSADRGAHASFASMLFNTAWMPSRTGDRLLSPHDGWVPTPKSEVRARESRFLATSCYHKAAQLLLESWPFLHLAQAPNASIIVRTLSHHAAQPSAAWSTGEMAKVYQALHMACWREHISAPRGARADQEDEPAPDTLQVREYLLHKPWIFLPDERCGSVNPADVGTGRFFTATDVAIRDMSGLFSDQQRRDSRVTNDIVRMVSQSVAIRTVKEHYPDKNVLELFTDWGVAREIGWDSYLNVLNTVHELVCKEDSNHIWSDDQTLHPVRVQIV